MLNANNRVEWSENREQPDGAFELFFTLAEKIDGIWSFFERSTYEVEWFPIVATKKLIKKAESLLNHIECIEPALTS